MGLHSRLRLLGLLGRRRDTWLAGRNLGGVAQDSFDGDVLHRREGTLRKYNACVAPLGHAGPMLIRPHDLFWVWKGRVDRGGDVPWVESGAGKYLVAADAGFQGRLLV